MGKGASGGLCQLASSRGKDRGSCSFETVPKSRFLELSKPPHFLKFFQVSDVLLKNSAFWTLHFLYSELIEVRNLTIYAPRSSRNTDGIDIDSSSDVIVSGCYIDTGDDVIALKSGMDYCGREFNRPTKNILIKDSTLVNENLAIGRDILSQHNKSLDILRKVCFSCFL